MATFKTSDTSPDEIVIAMTSGLDDRSGSESPSAT